MYAQSTTIHVPVEHSAALHHALVTHYLPLLEDRPGFAHAYVLVDPDERTVVQLLLVWDTYDSAELFARTGALARLVRTLTAAAPGLRVKCRGYHVSMALTAPAVATTG